VTREDLDWLTQQGVPFVATLSGPCMTPTLVDGDRVRIRPVDGLQLGDLVLVALQGVPQLHRLVFLGRHTIGHQGDAGLSPTLSSRAAVIGRAECFADGRAISLPGVRARLRHLVAWVICAVRTTRHAAVG